MKRFIQVFLFVSFFISLVFAQNINGRIFSSLYLLENSSDKSLSETYMRSYQGLNLNISKNQFTLHTRLNFETDFKNTLPNDSRLRFYNLYLEGRNLFDYFTLRVGRQTQYGQFGGLYDGVNLKFNHDLVSLSAYYGGNVPEYQKLTVIDNFSDNYTAGARLTVNPLDNLVFNFNYHNKNFKPLEYNAAREDGDLNPVNYLIRKNSSTYQYLSGDVSYTVNNIASSFVRIDYDLNYKQLSKLEFNTRVDAVKNLGLNVYYNFREPKISYNSIFSVFQFGNTQEVELSADYRFSDKITAIANYALVQFEGENSHRIGAGVNTPFGSFNYKKNLGYAGEMDAVSFYSAKSLLEGVLTPSVGLSYSSYKLSENDDRKDLLSLLAGVNVKPFRALSFDVQTQYFNNTIYKNDFRFLFKINYWFNTNLDAE